MKLRTEAGLFALAALTVVGGFWLAGKTGEVVGDQARKEVDRITSAAAGVAKKQLDQAGSTAAAVGKALLPFPFNMIP